METLLFTGISSYQRLTTTLIRKCLEQLARALGATPIYGPYASWIGEDLMVGNLSGGAAGNQGSIAIVLVWQKPQLLVDCTNINREISLADRRKYLGVLKQHMALIQGDLRLIRRGWDLGCPDGSSCLGGISILNQEDASAAASFSAATPWPLEYY